MTDSINYHETAHSIRLLNTHSDEMELRMAWVLTDADADRYPLMTIAVNANWKDSRGWAEFRLNNAAEVDALIKRLEQLRDSAFRSEQS